MGLFKPISELRRETAALDGSNRLDRHSDRRRGEADKRREPSRSRSQEPEHPVNGAQDHAPTTQVEKDKRLERKKSRSPSAERSWSKEQMISAVSVLQQLADQQH